MNIQEELLTAFRALTKEKQREVIEELKKCSAQSANRTEHPVAGELSHSHYTMENSNCKGKMKNEF